MLIAIAMLTHKMSRLLVTLLGIMVAFFLSATQTGLLVGWSNTNSALIRHANADLWVMARQTPAFDYGTAIPRNRLYQVRSIEGVEWAEGLFMGWNIWQRPDGRRVNVELVGLDEGLAGGPWQMKAGNLAVIRQPDRVVVDALYLDALGVRNLGDEVEMIGQRAIIGGISRDVRTFTASPFIFTSIPAAIRYDRRYRDDEITFVMARCIPGMPTAAVKQAIAAQVPEIEVLTSEEFAARSIRYWMLETGIGITVVATAVLGLVIGSIIVSQTLFAITQDHLENYATLLALGFGRRRLSGIIAAQSLILGTGGVGLGAALFFYAARASADTPIPLQITAGIFWAVVGLTLCCSVLASFMSIRSIFQLDPAGVFKA